MPGEDQRPIEPAGARAERLHAAQYIDSVERQHGRGRPLPRNRVAAPHTRAQLPGADRGELTVSDFGGSLHRQALDCVQVPVEDPPDRPVGARHLPDEVELCRRGRTRRSRARIPREHPGALEQPNRSVGKARRRLAVPRGGTGLDLGEHVIQT